MKINVCFMRLLFAAAGVFIFNIGSAQNNQLHKNLNIVYEITVNKKRHTGGLEETYNGGTKALFISDNNARIRIVSLMRIQSIFFNYDKNGLKKVSILKESGKKKYQFRLTVPEWKLYNKKYDSLYCDTSFVDSLQVAGYPCRKAVIKLEDERTVTVFYTDSIRMGNSFTEPLFRCIPGTVLQYEFSTKKGSVLFKAASVSTEKIAPAVFKIAAKGVPARKFRFDKKAKQEEDITEDKEE